MISVISLKMCHLPAIRLFAGRREPLQQKKMDVSPSLQAVIDTVRYWIFVLNFFN
jgi:hypothetical protein